MFCLVSVSHFLGYLLSHPHNSSLATPIIASKPSELCFPTRPSYTHSLREPPRTDAKPCTSTVPPLSAERTLSCSSTHLPYLCLCEPVSLGPGVLSLLSLMALSQTGLFTQAFAHHHAISQLTSSEHLLCAWQPGPVLGGGARALSDTVQMKEVLQSGWGCSMDLLQQR